MVIDRSMSMHKLVAILLILLFRSCWRQMQNQIVPGQVRLSCIYINPCTELGQNALPVFWYALIESSGTSSDEAEAKRPCRSIMTTKRHTSKRVVCRMRKTKIQLTTVKCIKQGTQKLITILKLLHLISKWKKTNDDSVELYASVKWRESWKLSFR